jgi:hypothetical protein
LRVLRSVRRSLAADSGRLDPRQRRGAAPLDARSGPRRARARRGLGPR